MKSKSRRTTKLKVLTDIGKSPGGPTPCAYNDSVIRGIVDIKKTFLCQLEVVFHNLLILHEGTYMSTDASTDPVIVATARSPIGRAFKGSMTEIRPDDLSAQIVTKAGESS